MLLYGVGIGRVSPPQRTHANPNRNSHLDFDRLSNRNAYALADFYSLSKPHPQPNSHRYCHADQYSPAHGHTHLDCFASPDSHRDPSAQPDGYRVAPTQPHRDRDARTQRNAHRDPNRITHADHRHD
jgi:hypothetical protein